VRLPASPACLYAAFLFATAAIIPLPRTRQGTRLANYILYLVEGKFSGSQLRVAKRVSVSKVISSSCSQSSPTKE
jgi:hypothetical protein